MAVGLSVRPSREVEQNFNRIYRYGSLSREEAERLARRNDITSALLDEIVYCRDNDQSLLIGILPCDHLLSISASVTVLIKELTKQEINLRASLSQVNDISKGSLTWLFHELNDDKFTVASPASDNNHFIIFKVPRADKQAHFYLKLDRVSFEDDETILVQNTVDPGIILLEIALADFDSKAGNFLVCKDKNSG